MEGGKNDLDKEKFASEIESNGEMMYRIAWSLLKNNEECNDALQEAVLKAWEKRRTLREESLFRTWITRILINVCYDTQRKLRRNVPFDADTDIPIPAPDPTLALALAALPENLRLPIVLVYSEGMTYAEVADILHLPIATVRGRIQRGKERLRKELIEE